MNANDNVQYSPHWEEELMYQQAQRTLEACLFAVEEFSTLDEAKERLTACRDEIKTRIKELNPWEK